MIFVLPHYFLLSSFMLVTAVPCQPGIFENIAVMPINLTKFEGAKNKQRSRIVKMWPHVNSHKVMTSPNLLSPHLLSSPPLLLYSPCLSAWQYTRDQPFSLDSGLSPGTAHRGHRTIRCLKRVSTKYMNKYDFAFSWILYSKWQVNMLEVMLIRFA